MVRRIRRRDRKVERISSETLESQGAGTWIEVRKKLTFQHLRPVIELAGWREDPRVKGESGADQQVEALNELLDSFGVALFPLVLGWNWVSDMEAELVQAPSQKDDGTVALKLETPIWMGSDFRIIEDDGSMGQPVFADRHPVYLGNYPDDYQVLYLVGVTEDGRWLHLEGSLSREYEPGAHYVIVGLPAPDGPQAFEWLGLEEMMWIVDQLASRFKAEMERQESSSSKKASG